MKIIKESPQILLQRTRVKAEIDHPGKTTPPNKEVKTALAKLKKANEDLIIIRHIYSKYGEGSSKIYANIYESEDALKRAETKKILKKLEEAKKKVEEPKQTE